jgi:uncharacterized protein (UPF0305 family)
MHRTQIYFDEALFEAIKKEANAVGISLSAYIREVLKKDLQHKKEKNKKTDFSSFAGMWNDRELTQESLREKAWKR